MTEAEALQKIAEAIHGLSTTIFIFGVLFLLFKDMGGHR